ncbi:glutamate racemase [Deinococcus roseus]|uniref:Glutamate racemase n=1 Tax=Deinococcus roseus TaxID=392414 RepID=A0ABQ2CVT4_9DEIO|nr:glutamate racemase [Deinococcus roseus]GGJ21969.1 glutamate racemase [Deinococcus roseus]
MLYNLGVKSSAKQETAFLQPGPQAPIGVFDSGMGGLSVLKELVGLLPDEHFIYLADTANCPYGQRPNAEIQQLSLQAMHFLQQQGAKALVVPCNTASAAALQTLREDAGPGFPVVGLVPAVKPAVERTQTGTVGVLATEGTLRGKLLDDVFEQFAHPRGVEVLKATHPRLVPLVEAAQLGTPETLEVLRSTLDPLMEKGMDHLVLGCTHYLFLKEALHTLYPHLNLLDSGFAVAKQTRRVLSEKHLLTETPQGSIEVFTTGDPDAVAPLVQTLWGEHLAVKHAAYRKEEHA